MQEYVRMRVDKTRHHDLPPEVDVAVLEGKWWRTLVDIGDGALDWIDDDGYVLEQSFLLGIKGQ